MGMEFRVLGPLEVVADGRALDLGGEKQRALLAALLLQANRVVPRSVLIDALWDEDPPATAPKALQVHVSQLRKLLGADRLATKPPGYLVRVDAGELDLDRFLAMREDGRLEEALSLWRGPPLADLAHLSFAGPAVGRLGESRLACLEERVQRDIARGLHAELVEELEALIRAHPLRERLRAQLMLCLYRSGRQADALDVFRATRELLVEELGLEPGPGLRESHAAILRQDPSLELPSAPGPEQVTPTAFVGRQAELDVLTGCLDDAFAGGGRLALLIGEPGIGKSRLAEELLAAARAHGARTLVGRCWEAGGAPAYWPWSQSLRAFVRDADPVVLRDQLGAGAGEIAQIVPDLRDRLPDLSPPAEGVDESARLRLFDAVAGFLRSAAESQPIVLFLDDLHAADASSLLLLRFVARELGSSRLLVLGACRDVDPTPGVPLSQMLAAIVGEPTVRRLSLDGLSEAETARYVALTAERLASPEVTAAVYAETEGNPLFVAELVRLYAEEGLPEVPAGTLSPAVPETVREVISRRLDRLGPDCVAMLTQASVLGREFALDAATAMAALSEDDALDRLDEAIVARVITDVPGVSGRLRFSHVLIRDVLYDAISAPRRLRLHRRAIETIEALHGQDAGPHLSELAHHAIAAGDLERGIGYGRRAGDRALAMLAYEEAARLYRAALAALDRQTRDDDATRCELLLSIGEAETRSGNTPDAKRAYLAAAGLARRHGFGRLLAMAAAGYGGRFMNSRAGRDRRLVPLLEDGLAALGDGDVRLRVRLLSRLGGAIRDLPEREPRLALTGEALALARRSGDPLALTFALDGRVAALLAPDTLDECLALSTEQCEVAEREGIRERLIQGHFEKVLVLSVLGEIEAAEGELAAADAVARELGQPHVWQVKTTAAFIATAAGRLEAADRLAADAFVDGQRAETESAVPIHAGQRHALARLRGGLEEVEPLVRAVATDYPARPVFRCVLAHLEFDLGRAEKARRMLGELVRDDCAVLPLDIERIYGISLLAELAEGLEDSHAAAVTYRLMAPWSRLNVSDHPEVMVGSVARYLGLSALAMGRLDEAVGHFEEAEAANERMRLAPWLAITRSDLARTLSRRDAAGDRRRAEALLDFARASFRELGMEDHERRARNLAPRPLLS